MCLRFQSCFLLYKHQRSLFSLLSLYFHYTLDAQKLPLLLVCVRFDKRKVYYEWTKRTGKCETHTVRKNKPVTTLLRVTRVNPFIKYLTKYTQLVHEIQIRHGSNVVCTSFSLEPFFCSFPFEFNLKFMWNKNTSKCHNGKYTFLNSKRIIYSWFEAKFFTAFVNVLHF